MSSKSLISFYQTNCINIIEELDNEIESLMGSNLQIDKDFIVVINTYKSIIIKLWNSLVESKENFSMIRRLYKAIDATYHVYKKDKRDFETRKNNYLETNNDDLNNFESEGLIRYRKKGE